MLSREQWEDAARFAGVEISQPGWPAGYPWTPHYDHPNSRVWRPNSDWNDFGRLLVLLLRWERNYVVPLPFDIMAALHKFQDAKYNGTDQELMHAGLLLAAAIGETMREEHAHRKNNINAHKP